MQKIQPEIKRIQHDHKENKEKQAQALLELYREHKVNPFLSIVLFAVQLPVLIALYQVFLKGLSGSVFTSHAFLGLIDLKSRSILMVGLAALAQFCQGWLGLKAGQADKMSRYLNYLMPAVTVMILNPLPSAISLYWFVTTLFSIVQQFFINKTLKSGNIDRQNKKPN